MRHLFTSALIAAGVTAMLLAFGFVFGLGLAHTTGIGLVATHLVYWPVMRVLDLSAQAPITGGLVLVLAGTAEYLYVLAVLELMRRSLPARKGSAAAP